MSKTTAPATGAEATQPAKEAAKKTAYTVASVAIRHNGELHAVGATVQLTAAEAERLGGMVTPAAAKPAKQTEPEA